jgi:hypothetical protein
MKATVESKAQPYHRQVLDAKGQAHKAMIGLILGEEGVAAFEYVGGPAIWEDDQVLTTFNRKLGTSFDTRTEVREIEAHVLRAYRTKQALAA